jgi:hypothetical protein
MGMSIYANNRANAKNPYNISFKSSTDFKNNQMNPELSASKSLDSDSNNQDLESDGF